MAVCENILACVRELTGWSRPKSSVVCGVVIFVLALTTALGYSVFTFRLFAEGSAWLDFGISSSATTAASGFPDFCSVLLQPLRLGLG